jgi:hypothetical protein
MPTEKAEIDAFHARKVALITGISGQVKLRIMSISNFMSLGWLILG